MMNKRELFLNAMTVIKEQMDVDDTLYELFGTNDGKMGDILFKLTEQIIYNLEYILQDGEELEWIDWWVYEAKLGEKNLKCQVNGNQYVFQNSEEFFDVIFAEQKD